jgi:AraC family transcriptional regulator
MTQTRMKQSPLRPLAEPRFVNGRPLLIAGLRNRYEAGAMDNIAAQWQRFVPHIGKIPQQAGQAAYGVCWQTSDGEAIEYLSGVEVTGFSGLRSEFTVVSIPAHRYAIFPHGEHVSKLRETVDAIFNQWLPESGYDAPVDAAETPGFLERYSQEFDPKTGTGGMELWVPIDSRRKS